MEGKIEDQDPRDHAIGKSWKILLIRGVIFSLIGIILIVWPSSGLAFTAIAFSIFIAVDGITQIVLGFRSNKTSSYWWGTVIRGVVEVIISVIIISNPKGFGEFGASALLVIIGILLIITSLIDFKFRQDKGGMVSAILIFLIGILLLTAPLFTLSVMLRIIGVAVVISGAGRTLKAINYKKYFT